jgi:hypothetical protein
MKSAMTLRSFFAVALAVLAAPALLAWSVPDSATGELRAGKAFSEVSPAPNGAVLVHAAVDIPATPKVVWTVMRDCGRAAKLIVTVTSCTVMQSDPAHNADIRETVTRGNLFIPTIHNVVREDFDTYRSIRFQKAGGNLKEEKGEWLLIPLNGGSMTRVLYENQVGADILAPPSLVREAVKHDTAKVLMNLRRECLSAN